MKTLVIFIAVLVLTVSIAFAGAVHGHVCFQSAAPVADATVKLYFPGGGGYTTTTTDSSGYYYITSPYTGTHQIEAWKWVGIDYYYDGKYDIFLGPFTAIKDFCLIKQ